MIEEAIGEGVAVRDEFGVYRGSIKFGGYVVRLAIGKREDIGGKPAIKIAAFPLPETPPLGPSKLIDGFGHEDAEPAVKRP